MINNARLRILDRPRLRAANESFDYHVVSLHFNKPPADTPKEADLR